MITKAKAAKRVKELRAQIERTQAEVEPEIISLSEAIDGAESEAESEALIAEQNALLEQAGNGVDFLLGRIAELGYLFELDQTEDNEE